MKILYFLLIILVTLEIIYCDDGDPPADGGTGGGEDKEEAQPEETEAPSAPISAPNQVIIMYQEAVGIDKFICCGAIIKEDRVLTAAHCLMNDMVTPKVASTLKVYGGTTSLENLTLFSTVRSVRTHAEYTNTNEIYTNNIAVLELETPLIMNDKTQVIALKTEIVAPETVCTVAGFGTFASGNKTEYNDMREATLKVYDKVACSEMYYNITSQALQVGALCAGDEIDVKKNCQADPGSALICDGLLAGIGSYSKGCTITGIPSIFTNVAKYEDWINPTEEEETNSAYASSCAFCLILIIQIFTYVVLN